MASRPHMSGLDARIARVIRGVPFTPPELDLGLQIWFSSSYLVIRSCSKIEAFDKS